MNASITGSIVSGCGYGTIPGAAQPNLKLSFFLADGNKYGNMLGHLDSAMDYVWTLSGGRMTLYPNLGKKSISGDDIIFEPGSAYNLDRKTLHLADWDGDGRNDIIFVDGNSLNTVAHVWLNR
ncbi:carbohydrate esterase family 3 [Apiospora phragmitis]|uniref:Carbohydrate esterase family 3 n=1 Tax=Apiospora phragmitis TaxID=2905665 RepID=A0ABR1TTW9_9PEZI